MTALTLSDALVVATAARNRGASSRIVTVVASIDVRIAAGMRAVLQDQTQVAGELSPDLLRAILSIGEEPSRPESRLYSFRRQGEDLVPARTGTGGVDVFVEVLVPRPRLVVVGAGHIAVPLVRMAALAGFETVVVDDRPDYANAERFPDADHIEVGPYRETVAGLNIHGETFVVLVTRGHVHDQACLEEVLQRAPAYVGMIGSKRRVRTVAAHAVAAGVDPESVKRVYAPIGLDIGARTPAEIAVAILAEIISVRRGRQSGSLALGERLGV